MRRFFWLNVTCYFWRFFNFCTILVSRSNGRCWEEDFVPTSPAVSQISIPIGFPSTCTTTETNKRDFNLWFLTIWKAKKGRWLFPLKISQQKERHPKYSPPRNMPIMVFFLKLNYAMDQIPFSSNKIFVLRNRILFGARTDNWELSRKMMSRLLIINK